MMTQTNTSIFATPDAAFVNQAATPTKLSITPRVLVMCDAAGNELNRWEVTQQKSTLGSSEVCSLRCPFPGVSEMHLLIVCGTRQIFVRLLKGKLSQDGIPVNELLLSDARNYFEIGGYRFTLSLPNRRHREDELRQNKRMRFALAKPMTVSSSMNSFNPPEQDDQTVASANSVAKLMREVIEPLEAQIDSLLLPLAEFQAQSLQAQLTATAAAQQQSRQDEQQRELVQSEIVSMVARQSAAMDTLTERITDVNQQLSTLERVLAQDLQTNSASLATTEQTVTVQQSAIEQLQSGMVSVAESLKQLQERQCQSQRENSEWKNEVQLQLQQLTTAVSEFSGLAENTDRVLIVEAIESLKSAHESAQHEIQRWQNGIQQQLGSLTDQLTSNSEGRDLAELPQSVVEALEEITSKHEASLAELQNWKTELRTELQQLLESAVQSRQPDKAANAVQQSTQKLEVTTSGVGNTPPTAIRQTNHHCDQESYQPIGASTFYTATTNEYADEAVAPELVDESMIERLRMGTDDSISAAREPAQAGWNRQSDSEQAWSALTTDWSLERPAETTSPGLPSEQLQDHWLPEATSGVLENSNMGYTELKWDMSQVDSPASEQSSSDESSAEEFHTIAYASEYDQASDEESLFQQASQSHSLQQPESAIVAEAQPTEDAARQPTSLPSWWVEASEDSHVQRPLALDKPDSTPSELQGLKDLADHQLHQPKVGSLDEPQESQLQRSLNKRQDQSSNDESGEFFGFGVESRSSESKSSSLESKQASKQDYLAKMSALRDLSREALEEEQQFDSSQSDNPESVFNDESLTALRSRFDAINAPAEPARESVQSTSASSVQEPQAKNGPGDEEESVEQYMKSLLARMRGMPEESPPPSKSSHGSHSSPATAPVPTFVASDTQSAFQAVNRTEATGLVVKEPMDLENYTPISNAPENNKNMSALRDLANTTARTAIHKSTRRRTLSGSLMRFAISAIAFTVAAALFAINGLAVNVALIATGAAFFVGLIWGYEGMKSLKPLLQKSFVLQPLSDDDEVPIESEE